MAEIDKEAALGKGKFSRTVCTLTRLGLERRKREREGGVGDGSGQARELAEALAGTTAQPDEIEARR